MSSVFSLIKIRLMADKLGIRLYILKKSPNFMNPHSHQTNRTKIDQSANDIFRFPTREETLRAKAKRQELEPAKSSPTEVIATARVIRT
jgi:hypothetical protein